MLITSADSQIRVFDGLDLIHKFKGIHNLGLSYITLQSVNNWILRLCKEVALINFEVAETGFVKCKSWKH